MSKKKSVKPAPKRTSAVKIFDNKENKQATQRWNDGFQNLAMKLGIATPGGEGSADNLISQGKYNFNLVTRNRILLEEMYRGSWLVGRIIDCFAEDMTRKGITVTTNKGAEKLQKYRVAMARLKIWQSVEESIKWGRLYGGAIGVHQIEGQKLDTPLDTSTVGKGDYKGIIVYDRWQLQPVLQQLIATGPDMGLPAFYDIILGANLNDPAKTPGGVVVANASGVVRVHHTRCFRMGGHKLPFFQAITEMMWEESVVERVYDRLVMFDTATASTAGLIGRALLRTVGIDGLREILASGGEAKEGLLEMFNYMRLFQSSEGLTLLDKEDSFETTAYSFAGLSDVNNQFSQEVSGAAETPLTRLFGQAPAGMNATGEGDMKNYHETINAKQESKLRGPMEIINQLVWQSTFGRALPDDFEMEFTPLQEVTALERSQIATANTTSIVSAHGDGLINTATAMKELKNQSAESGLFTHITDEMIEEAENEEPPEPESDPVPNEPGSAQIDPKQEPSAETGTVMGEAAEPKTIGDAFRRFISWGNKKKAKAADAPKPKRKLTADQKTIRDFIGGKAKTL